MLYRINHSQGKCLQIFRSLKGRLYPQKEPMLESEIDFQSFVQIEAKKSYQQHYGR